MARPFHPGPGGPRQPRRGQGPGRPRRPQDSSRLQGPAKQPPAGWDHVASWYDKLVGEEGSDYHQQVILPAAMQMLDPKPGERLLDLCCGQGVFTRLLAEKDPAHVLGVDASPKLIAAAEARGAGQPNVRYVVADARNLGSLADGGYDAAACLMAVQDVDPIEPLFRELGRALRPGGRAVIVMMHPCFRIPRQSSWGWDEERKLQYRRLDRYCSSMAIPIAIHPGGDPRQHTTFFHRPLAAYINALSAAGMAITQCQELLSHRLSEPGAHSRGENRAKLEFPVFLAMKAMKT